MVKDMNDMKIVHELGQRSRGLNSNALREEYEPNMWTYSYWTELSGSHLNDCYFHSLKHSAHDS